MKEIKLTQGKVTVVDDADFEWLNQWKWHLNGSYAARWIHLEHKKRKKVYMHKFIMNLINSYQEGKFIDHINQNTFDNRRKNLRLATNSQNQHNTKISVRNTSGYKGVYWDKKYKRWCARARIFGKDIFGGGFKNKLDAVNAYIKLIGGVFA